MSKLFDRSPIIRRRIVGEFMAGDDFVVLSKRYALPAYGLGLSGSIEGIIRRALQEPRKRRKGKRQ